MRWQEDGMKRRRKKKQYLGKVWNGIGMVVLIVVILICIPLTVPRIFGFQVYNVISGSMEPAIPTGSLVYVKSVAASSVEKEDVIAFYSEVDTGAIITHRVVENHKVSGEFITKGDANKQKDPLPVKYEYLLGKVVVSIPFLGELLALVATTKGKIVVACMIGFSVVSFLLGSRFEDA